MLKHDMYKSEETKINRPDFLEGYPEIQDVMTSENNNPDVVKIENQLGTFEFDRAHFLHFRNGLIGFTGIENFALGNLPYENMEQFKLLQCIDVPELSFIVLPTAADNNPYDDKEIEEICKNFRIAKEDLALLFIITIRQSPDGVKMTMNKRAPIILDTKNKTGRQFILPNPDYSVQHEL